MADDSLTLDLLGSFRAAVGGTLLTGIRSDKARAWLAYLAVEGDRPHTRSSLATLLWPDMLDDAALGNLRKTLHRLREVLAPTGEPVLLVTRQTIALNRGARRIDITLFRDLLAEVEAHRHTSLHQRDAWVDRLARVAVLCRGELLAGFGLPDAEPFNEWLRMRRERFLHAALGALYRLTAALLEAASTTVRSPMPSNRWSSTRSARKRTSRRSALLLGQRARRPVHVWGAPGRC